MDPEETLTQMGWRVVDSDKVCGNLDSYRDYVQSSRAEWSVQKNGYVVGRPGWFSCRSACYLPAGRPVVVEDTGFSDIIPTGGLVRLFHDGIAIEAVGEVERRYAMHAQAARELAEEFFDARKVLSLLVETAMVAPCREIKK